MFFFVKKHRGKLEYISGKVARQMTIFPTYDKWVLRGILRQAGIRLAAFA